MSLRLLCVTAHPDDESGAFGGALLQAHARGIRTSVLCLTEGRAASHRGEASNGDELARLRRKEFAAALGVLGVTEGKVLDYPDGELRALDFLEVVSNLVRHMRRFRPQVVLTFGGDGSVNQHPDHTMTCLFTTAAFHWAGHTDFCPELAAYRPQKLYYSATPFLFKRVEQVQEIAVVPPSLVLELGELGAKKLEAFQQHRSQADVLAHAREVFEKVAAEERYLLVAARGLRSSAVEADMFQGVLQDSEDDPGSQ